MKPVRHTYEFRVTPVAKPRQTQSDVWKKRPAVVAYRAFADTIRAAAKTTGFTMPDHGATVMFYLPMPKSWTMAKRDARDRQPHQQKPDVDNLLKAFLDALCNDDCTVWNLAGVEKRWAEFGRIVVTLTPAEVELAETGESIRH